MFTDFPEQIITSANDVISEIQKYPPAGTSLHIENDTELKQHLIDAIAVLKAIEVTPIKDQQDVNTTQPKQRLRQSGQRIIPQNSWG